MEPSPCREGSREGGGARVTAVIATFNRRPLLEAAVRSTLEQTLGDVALVVVDDGSSDGTPRYCSELARTVPRVRCLRVPHRGPCVARNAGLELVESPWVAFLDDDDLWVPEALERLLALAGRTGARAVAGRGLRFFSRNGNLDPREVAARPEAFGGGPWPPGVEGEAITVEELLLRPLVPLHGVLFSTEYLRELGGFDPDFPFAEDYHLLLRAAAEEPLPLLDECVALYRWHPGQRWSDLLRRARETRVVLERFLGEHPEVRSRIPSRLLGDRLGRLAQEEAYAALLAGRGTAARAAALRSLAHGPWRAKPWLYWCAGWWPGGYRLLRGWMRGRGSASRRSEQGCGGHE